MNWKKILSISFLIIFMIITILLVIQRPSFSRNPIEYSILVLGVSANIIYEYYRKRKEEKELLQIKKIKIQKLNKNYKPVVSPEIIPEELFPFIKIINIWGISNKILRENLYEKSNNRDLIILKNFIDKNIDLINNIIKNNENKELTNALKLTLKSYNELGLWTWEPSKK